MGVPASLIRRLMARAAKTALSEGMAVERGAKGGIMPGLMRQAMMRQANLSNATERGYTQLNRLRALLEGMAGSNPDNMVGVDAETLMGRLTGVEKATDQKWRKLMGGE